MKVANRLESDREKSGLWFSHRDYCGHGLICIKDEFHLIEVHDGYAEYSDKIKSWNNKNDFCSWLAKQSDYSLSGADKNQSELYTQEAFSLNNQRLTQQRMIDYVAYGRR